MWSIMLYWLLILLIIIQCETSLICVYSTIFPSCVSLCLYVGFKTSHGSWISPMRYPLPNEFFPLLVHNLWASTCQPYTSFILHRNLIPYCCLAPLAWYSFVGSFPGLALLHLQKGFKFTHLVPTSTMKGILITLLLLPQYHLLGK